MTIEDFKYQIGFMGGCLSHSEKIKEQILSDIDELGISRDMLTFLEGEQISDRNVKAPFVLLFFGPTKISESAATELDAILADSYTTIPCVDTLDNFTKKVPTCLEGINGFPLEGNDPYVRLSTLILENFRLLRKERRLFISYKRSESQTVAIQLYESLDEAGFDVFLDTRSLSHGSDVQDVLFHRMADSDLVVLLDTPNFRSNHWTKVELARANTTSIQILHLLWPGVSPDPESAFSEFLPLDKSNFASENMLGDFVKLKNEFVDHVISKTESLRARALASRHRMLVDSFCDRAREFNIPHITVEPQKYIYLEALDGRKIGVVPTIGVPNAKTYQELEEVISKQKPDIDQIRLLYDERGILDEWQLHLNWLNSYLSTHAIKVSQCEEWLLGEEND